MSYDDNVTRSTTDGSHIGGSFNWDMRVAKGNGYHSRQLTNSTLLSTHQELYSVPRRRGAAGAIVGLIIMAVSLYLLVFKVGVLNGLYLWLTN